jgi:DNA-binding NtrC family response regulator
LVLAKHFVDLFVQENKMKKLALSSSAKEQLMRYNYPGNVRELKAIIDLACVMCDGTEISADDISFPSVKGNEEYMSMEKTLKEYTVDIIAFFLKKYNNNVVEVAQKLDVGKSTIYNLINSGDLKKV